MVPRVEKLVKQVVRKVQELPKSMVILVKVTWCRSVCGSASAVLSTYWHLLWVGCADITGSNFVASRRCKVQGRGLRLSMNRPTSLVALSVTSYSKSTAYWECSQTCI